MANPKATPEKPDAPQGMSRREFLNFAWLASLGFMTVNLAGVTFFFALPRFREGEFGGTFTLGTVAELPAVGTPPINYPKLKMWLTHPESGIMAIYKVCTHLGCLYAWSDQENKFICPCHGSQFEYDGTYIRGPAPRSLDRFVVQVINPDTGEVLSESVGGEPLPVPDNPNYVIRVDTGRRINGNPHA